MEFVPRIPWAIVYATAPHEPCVLAVDDGRVGVVICDFTTRDAPEVIFKGHAAVLHEKNVEPSVEHGAIVIVRELFEEAMVRAMCRVNISKHLQKRAASLGSEHAHGDVLGAKGVKVFLRARVADVAKKSFDIVGRRGFYQHRAEFFLIPRLPVFDEVELIKVHSRRLAANIVRFARDMAGVLEPYVAHVGIQMVQEPDRCF